MDDHTQPTEAPERIVQFISVNSSAYGVLFAGFVQEQNRFWTRVNILIAVQAGFLAVLFSQMTVLSLNPHLLVTFTILAFLLSSVVALWVTRGVRFQQVIISVLQSMENSEVEERARLIAVIRAEMQKVGYTPQTNLNLARIFAQACVLLWAIGVFLLPMLPLPATRQQGSVDSLRQEFLTEWRALAPVPCIPAAATPALAPPHEP